MNFSQELTLCEQGLAACSLAEIVSARLSLDAHAELVLKNTQTGEHVKQAALHQSWTRHIKLCRDAKKYAGIMAPWGHGKTEAIVNFALHEIGKDRNVTIKVVSANDDLAAQKTDEIEKYIEFDEDYKATWPGIERDPASDWSKHRAIVKRDSKSGHGTLESWGVLASGVGGRCHILLFDDPVDMRNAILNPADRNKVDQSTRGTWIPRLYEDGFAAWIGTAYHQDDATHRALKNPAWCWLIQRISAGFEWIECEVINGEGIYSAPIPPIKALWTKEQYAARLLAVGSREFDRGYRQRAISDEDLTFKHASAAFKYDLAINDIVRPDWPRFAGCDPFGQWVVIYVIALSPDGKRVPIDIIRMKKASGSQTIEAIWQAHQRHMIHVLMLENNGAQETIRQWAIEKHRDIPTAPFTTGNQKANRDIGLPSMDVEFENGTWIIPAAHFKDHAAGCACGWCAWRDELLAHPVSATEDCIMAMWFAREAVRKMSTCGVSVI